MEKICRKSLFIKGVKTGIPIAIGYIPIAIAFGILARSEGVPIYITSIMSLMVYAGASQFVAVNLLGLGAGFGEIVLTTFILNLRHLLMTAAVSQRIEDKVSGKWRALLAFGITDETFSIAAVQKDKKLDHMFILGLNIVAFSSWNIGTLIGVTLGSIIPTTLQQSMGIALYAMFIGLLVPSLKKSRPVLIVALIAALSHSILVWAPFLPSISTGWSIIIATIISAMSGAILFKEGSVS